MSLCQRCRLRHAQERGLCRRCRRTLGEWPPRREPQPRLMAVHLAPPLRTRLIGGVEYEVVFDGT
jgi:hypothetical protein